MPGAYVVHIDHGIARFAGVIRKSVDGYEREYLELHYAEGDKLFVPTDQLDRVSRYIGPSDREPRPTRLASGEWQRAKQRVRKAVQALARDLLALYAAREVLTGLCAFAGHAVADGAGGVVPLHRDAGPDGGDRGGEAGHGERGSRWTASSAATWATGRRKSRSARRSRP